MRKKRARPSPASPSDLQLDLLLSLCEAEDGLGGSGELVDAVGELRGQEVALATFYRQLQQAVDAGWVERRDAERRGGPGRPERLYRLTDPGRQALGAGLEHYRRRVSRARELGVLAEKAK